MAAVVGNDMMKSVLDLAASSSSAHALFKAVFRAGMLECGFEQALASSMDHTEKSIGLRSGLLEGHICFDQNEGKTREQKS